MVKLYLGDCLDIMLGFEPKSVDMILCDLPYGTTSCSWDVIIPFDRLWDMYHKVIKDDGAIVLFGSQPFTSLLGASNIKELRYSWAWDKIHATGHLNAKKRPMKQVEDILVFYKKQPLYNPQGLIYAPKNMKNSKHHLSINKENATSTLTGGLSPEYIQVFTNWPRNLIRFHSANGNKEHPTQKPVELLEYLIKTYTNELDTVLDNTMGSGTTGVAALNTNRKFIGIEKELKFFEIAEKKLLDISVNIR